MRDGDSSGFCGKLRTAVVLCTMLVFVLQGYVLQTHIHPLHLSPNEVMAAAQSSAPVHHGSDDSDDCPLCQAFALSGSFTAPVVILLPMPQAALFAVLSATRARLAGLQVQFGWRSRAPPPT